MASAAHNHAGSGFNYLCMHPDGQQPEGATAADNNGALLYGVEYEDTSALDKNRDKDAACAVCQWRYGGTVYVDWGRGDGREEDSSEELKCSHPGHEVIYTGLVMSTHYGEHKAESICVDLERDTHAGSADSNKDGGRLYTTEMQEGATDEEAYPHDHEVGCTVCGLRVRDVMPDGELAQLPEQEGSVFTIWGSRTCPRDSRLVYEGFMAGSHGGHSGGGANLLCMTLSGVAPRGFSSGNQDGNLLYGTEYQNTGALDKNHDGDAACAVCEYAVPRREVYIQWGRSKTCSNNHAQVYAGLVMSTGHDWQKSVNLCVDLKRDVHGASDKGNQDGAVLFTTEVEAGSADEGSYPHDVEVGCSACAAPAGKSVFTRWGSRSCPSGTTRLYEGWMASAHADHSGGGANSLCMHSSGEQPEGASKGNENGNRLYGMEYQDTGAADAANDQDAACAVCQLDRWEQAYTQWGRSDGCSNGHETLYSGYVMANNYGQKKGEFVCVDSERGAHRGSHAEDKNGGRLYTTEMEAGSSDEDKYPPNVEVGCSVCAALPQESEMPFAAKEGNAIHGAWVKVQTVHASQEASIGAGFGAAPGTDVPEEETGATATARAWDAMACFSASFEAASETSLRGLTASSPVPVEFQTCGGLGGEDGEMEAIAVTAAREAAWSTQAAEGSEVVFSVPDSPPDDLSLVASSSMHLWQWQWSIREARAIPAGLEQRSYVAKAKGHFVLAPSDPQEAEARRPCCYPGQELGVWYPFHCRSAKGLLPHAEKAAHCKVGPPADEATGSDEVGRWLDSMGVPEAEYNGTAPSRVVDGQSLMEMGTIAMRAAKDVFGVSGRVGDAFRVLLSVLRQTQGS